MIKKIAWGEREYKNVGQFRSIDAHDPFHPDRSAVEIQYREV